VTVSVNYGKKKKKPVVNKGEKKREKQFETSKNPSGTLTSWPSGQKTSTAKGGFARSGLFPTATSEGGDQRRVLQKKRRRSTGAELQSLV